MQRRYFLIVKALFFKFLLEFSNFLRFFSLYTNGKIKSFAFFFETYKNSLVRLFIVKRGRYTRPFLHLATISVLGVGVLTAPFLANTYPIFSSNNQNLFQSQEKQSIVIGENVFETQVSQKPRDKVIEYTVQKGDTVSTMAEKFGVSSDTIRWENDLTSDNLTIGDTLRILPVTGTAHKVQKGDTVYTIAKRFDTEAQKIVDFPFNEFANPETFSLVEGQILIVPDGVKPSSQPFYAPKRLYIAQGPVSVSSAGFTWPVRGIISQFATWYHMAIDITAPIGTPIVAAQNGKVVEASTGTWNFGYGNDVEIDNSSGFSSHYAHLSGVNVNVGDDVLAGKTIIGWVGLSGRTTGSHVHFEVKRNGVLVNPLNFLQ